MSDSVQGSVEAVLQVKDLASQTLNKIADLAEKLKGNFDKVAAVDPLAKFRGGLAKMSGGPVQNATQGIKSLAFELAGAAGVALSARTAFEKFVDSNAEAETMGRELGATFSGLYKYGNMSPLDNFNEALVRGNELVERFGESSFKLGIPEEKFGNMAKTLAPAVAAAGKGTQDLAQLTEDLAKIARGTGKDFETTAQQVMMAAQWGNVRKGSFLAQHGVTTKSLAGLNEAERMGKVLGAIKLMHPDSLLQVKTYADIMSTVRARVDQITQAAGKPVFDKAKKILEEASEWLLKNRKEVERIAGLVADKMVKGMELAVDAIKAAYKYWDEIRGVVEVVVYMLAAKKAASFASELLTAANGLKEAAAALHSVKLGDWKNTAGSFGKMAAAGMVAEAALFGYAIGTALNDYLMKNVTFMKWMHGDDKPIQTEAQKAKDRAGDKQEAVTREVIERLRGVALTQKDSAAWLANIKERTAQGESFNFGGGRKTGLGDISEVQKQLMIIGGGAEYAGPKGAPTDRPPEVANNFNDFRGSRFDITQSFAEGFDPDRIALAFSADLASLGERKASSNGYSSAFAVR